MISFRVIIACVFAHRKSAVIVENPKRESHYKMEIAINFSVYAYMSKKIAIGINYIEDSGNEI